MRGNHILWCVVLCVSPLHTCSLFFWSVGKQDLSFHLRTQLFCHAFLSVLNAVSYKYIHTLFVLNQINKRQKINGKATYGYASVCTSVKSAWSAATKLHQYLCKKKLQELLLLGLFLVRNIVNVVLPLWEIYYCPFLIAVRWPVV